MKRFLSRELGKARDYCEAGGQALHTHRFIANRAKAPKCFLREVDAGREIGHLLDRDYGRLTETARALGVKVIRVERRGTTSQHVDLCGGPLAKAIAMCEAEDAMDRAVEDALAAPSDKAAIDRLIGLAWKASSE